MLQRRRFGRLAQMLTSFILLMGLGVSAVHADVVTMVADRDATLFEDVTGSIASGSGPTVFVGANRTLNNRRAVLHFDVNSVLPPGSNVQTVELWIYVSDAPDTTPRDVTAHRVLANWGEGASASAGGGGASSQPGDTTWLHRFYPDELWTNAGGDYEPSSSAIAELGVSGWQFWSSEQLAADVQTWIDDPSSNFGWLLEGEEGTSQSARGFHSSESAQAELRPYVRIEYQGCCVATETTSWSRLKAEF